MKKFPNYKQADFKDCGPTCIKIIAKHYGKTIKIQELRDFSETTREGSNLLFLSDAAEKIGFRTLGVKLNLKSLQEVPLPCVLHWNKEHYVVLYNIKKDIYQISDPAFGLIEYNESDFMKFWIGFWQELPSILEKIAEVGLAKTLDIRIGHPDGKNLNPFDFLVRQSCGSTPQTS